MVTNRDCKTIFVVEIKINGAEWNTTPKIFYSRKEAEKERKQLKIKYNVLAECRVVARREKEQE